MYLPKWLKKSNKETVCDTDKSHVKGETRRKINNELHKYVDTHKNQRCFVVGNGPSLNKIDMSLLKDEITLGSNRVYLGFEKWGYYFKYWSIIDELQIKQFYEEYNKKLPDEMVKFVPVQFTDYFTIKNICPLNVLYRYEPFPQFSDSPDKLYEGWSVTYMLLQIAVIMGCNPIYLVGVDYSYKITDKEMVGKKWSDKNSQSHFTPDYCAADKGVVWNVPQFDKTDAAYKCVSQWAEANDVQIFNATPGSKLDFFPKVKYEDLF